MRIVCISDTHGRARDIVVPDGDVLVHAGDLTGSGDLASIEDEADWLRSLPHAHKVVIAGNHDWGFQREPDRARERMHDLTYLEDSETTIGGLRFWGSPWQPWFASWAFNLERGAEIRAKWDLIPAGIDVLVIHGPPLGILDRTIADMNAGCADQLAAVQRVRPRLHVFGHIHEGYGRLDRDGTIFVNASTCNEWYQPVHAPIVVDL
jgi:Icc-related predicted phosphoesterase